MNETHMVWAELLDWLRRSQRFIIKKLSRNDCSWADDSGKHQAGVYVPRELQNAGFFPQVSNTNPAKPHILDARFSTWWPASSESIHSALKHYTNGNPPAFSEQQKWSYAAIASFIAGVMPPSAMLGRSWL